MSPVTWGFEEAKDYRIKVLFPPSPATTEKIVWPKANR
jgi:hypothetical protein